MRSFQTALRLARRWSGLAALLACCVCVTTCVYPATQVDVLIGTDIDLSVPLRVTVRVTRDADAGADMMAHAWVRSSSPTGLDAGFVDAGGTASPVGFPFEFVVVPGNGPHDGHVHVFVEADAGGVVFRRHEAFSFIPHERLTLPIFLSNRCALVASSGCVGSATCTQARYCEEQGLTCGDEGSCVAVDTHPTPDASFGDVGHPLGPCGTYGGSCCQLGLACQTPLSCVAGRCQRCLDHDEACCDGAQLRSDGTMCGAMPDACHHASTCSAGVCQPQLPMDDGATCASTTDVCHHGGTCTAGVCGAVTNQPDGTPCGATDPCHDASTCNGGACTAGSARPDGTPWGTGGIQRCCGGQAVSVNTSQNCNVCGLACSAGACAFHSSVGQYLCPCTGANAQCAPLICRSTAYPDGNTCIPSNGGGTCTGVCPGGSSCHMSSGAPNYCTY